MRGKTAVMVGGAPKEPNRDRLETYLRLATLEWPVIDGPRKVEAVAQRIAKGAYDLVLIVQAHIASRGGANLGRRETGSCAVGDGGQLRRLGCQAGARPVPQASEDGVSRRACPST